MAITTGHRPLSPKSEQLSASLAKAALRTQARQKLANDAASKKTLWKRIGAGVAAVLAVVGIGFGVKKYGHRK